jgi:hypothetical protein
MHRRVLCVYLQTALWHIAPQRRMLLDYGAARTTLQQHMALQMRHFSNTWYSSTTAALNMCAFGKLDASRCVLLLMLLKACGRCRC